MPTIGLRKPAIPSGGLEMAMGEYDQIRANLEQKRAEVLTRLEQLRQDLRRPNNPDTTR